MAFECSYADVPFLVPDPEIEAWIDQTIPFEQHQILLPPPAPWTGKNTHGLLGTTLPPYPRLRLGDFFYPTGAQRWGVFHGLATKSLAKDMVDAATTGVNGTVQGNIFVLRADLKGTIREGNVLSINTPMWLLPPRVLAACADGQGEPFYLITLVDDRYLWWLNPTGLVHPVSGTTTWANLFDQIAPVIGRTINYPQPINPVYGNPNPDSDLWSNYEPTPVLLDALAANIGCVVVRELDGLTITILPASNSVHRWFANQDLNIRVAGGNALTVYGPPGDPPLPAAGQITESLVTPASVTVTFPKYQGGEFEDSRPVPTWIKDSYGDVWTEVITLAQAVAASQDAQVMAANITMLPGTTKVLHTTAKAVYTNPGDAMPNNEPTLNMLATQMAVDYYTWLWANGVDEVYPGIQPWIPDGSHDLLWSYRDGTSRMIPRPWSHPLEFQHG